jgi:hypothetical protein
VRVAQRVAYATRSSMGRSVLDYEPHGQAAAEVERLYKWLTKTLRRNNRCRESR